jgi:hypothetical protein
MYLLFSLKDRIVATFDTLPLHRIGKSRIEYVPMLS